MTDDEMKIVAAAQSALGELERAVEVIAMRGGEEYEIHGALSVVVGGSYIFISRGDLSSLVDAWEDSEEPHEMIDFSVKGSVH